MSTTNVSSYRVTVISTQLQKQQGELKQCVRPQWTSVSVKLHLRDGQRVVSFADPVDESTRRDGAAIVVDVVGTSACLFVRSFVCFFIRCVRQGRPHPM